MCGSGDLPAASRGVRTAGMPAYNLYVNNGRLCGESLKPARLPLPGYLGSGNRFYLSYLNTICTQNVQKYINSLLKNSQNYAIPNTSTPQGTSLHRKQVPGAFSGTAEADGQSGNARK